MRTKQGHSDIQKPAFRSLPPSYLVQFFCEIKQGRGLLAGPGWDSEEAVLKEGLIVEMSRKGGSALAARPGLLFAVKSWQRL